MVESVLTAWQKVMLAREPGIQQRFKKNRAVLDADLYPRRQGFDSLFWSKALAGSIWCLTAGKQAELEAGWLSACPYAPSLSQISCSQKWLTDPLGTALKGRALFSASGLVNEEKGSPGHWNCCWPKHTENIKWKMGFEMCFPFQKSWHVFGCSHSICHSYIWNRWMPLAGLLEL